MDEAERDDDARRGLLETRYESAPDTSYAKSMWYAWLFKMPYTYGLPCVLTALVCLMQGNART